MKNQKNNLTTFYIVPHGESEWNVKGIVQGQTKHIPLTQKGEEQAKQLAQKITHIDFDLVYSSDQLRALKTAQLLILNKKLIIKTTEALREKNYGSYEGKPVIKLRQEIQTLIDQLVDFTDKQKLEFKPKSDIESDAEIVSRLINFLRELAIANPNKNILIVSHGAVMRSFLTHLGYGTYGEMHPSKVKIANTAYIVIECDGIDFFIKEVNGITKFKVSNQSNE